MKEGDMSDLASLTAFVIVWGGFCLLAILMPVIILYLVLFG